MHISCPHCHAAYEVGPMIKNAILVCHRCHAEFNLGEESEKQRQEQTESEAPLPLFEQTQHIDKAVQEDQSDETDSSSKETEVGHTQITDHDTGHHASAHNDLSKKSSPTIPVPAFLDGEYRFTQSDEEKSSDRLLAPSEKRITSKDEPEYKTAARTDEPTEDSSDHPLEELESEQTPTANEVSTDDHSSDEPLANNDGLEEAVEADSSELPIAPPTRKKVAIWPWLVFILLLISATGFWYKKDVWLDHPWVRSFFINMHLPVEVRNKDWLIIPDSVQGQWLKRDDGSQVLVIQGRVENRLYCELAPPKILVKFFDDSGINESLDEKRLVITEPPLMEQVKRAPFVMPPEDSIPIEAQGARGFILVVESLPERTSDFTLTPVVD